MGLLLLLYYVFGFMLVGFGFAFICVGLARVEDQTFLHGIFFNLVPCFVGTLMLGKGVIILSPVLFF